MGLCVLPPLAIVAVIAGHRALRQTRWTGEDGDGLARTGLVLGYVALALAVLALLLLLAPAARPGPSVERRVTYSLDRLAPAADSRKIVSAASVVRVDRVGREAAE